MHSKDLKIGASIVLGCFACCFVVMGFVLILKDSIGGTSADLSLAWTRGAIYLCSGILTFAILVHQVPASSDHRDE